MDNFSLKFIINWVGELKNNNITDKREHGHFRQYNLDPTIKEIRYEIYQNNICLVCGLHLFRNLWLKWHALIFNSKHQIYNFLVLRRI